ncbi:LPS assembly lipoprotein LptE [Afifella sp. IM 167]|uniref:LPS assembly lipoprotein LptE n=1 Tax=Afifella sp. IM 167 TaxID=2033586 RepID=UPI001CCCC331|nr:LPS assembly lipoprotein LptE [Afifella sp. IM 167]
MARRASLAFVLAGATLFAGCQIRPLYAPTPTGQSVQAELRAVDVEPPASRAEQVFRNVLLFGIDDAVPAPNRYRLTYAMSLSSGSVGIETVTGVPTAYQITATLSYRLTDIESSKTVTDGTIATVASYDRSSQVFANIRAERDAEDRAATTLAGILKSRLAAFLATN